MDNNLIEQFQLEYVFKGRSVSTLWTCIGTEEGLSRWFADEVQLLDDNHFRFTWNGNDQNAEALCIKPHKRIRFRWDGDDPNLFFEFRIHIDELTHVLSLSIIDHALSDEREDAELLWNSQVDKLRRHLGI
ncbi:MAG: SRPBCC domain-containing protein [Prevotellaceae bacterium]|jgi:uncharacterized protein YndB with AHSA1/START domain|nr:SRPBCC domain-containing protein [Prevotellaceae bacterium]